MTGLLRNLVLVLNAAALVTIGVGIIRMERYRSPWIAVMRGLRLRHFAVAPPLLALLIVVSTALERFPPLRFSWWELLGGTGNPGFGVTQDGSKVVTAAMTLLLAGAVPVLAWLEEGWFRCCAHRWTWPELALQSVRFGLVHTVVGVSVATGLSISLCGVFYALMYRRAYRRYHSIDQAQLASARYHAAFNYLIVVLVILWLLVGS